MYGGLAAINDNCRVGINPRGQLSNNDPMLPWTSTRWEEFTEADAPIADTGLNLGFKFDVISPGATKTFKFAYVLSADQVNAALASLDSVTILSPSSSATGNTLFQIALDSTAGNCTNTYAGNPACTIEQVKFYIKTPEYDTYQLLNWYSGVDGQYTYSHYVDTAEYVIGSADTVAQLYVEVMMEDSSLYTQTSVTTIAPQQINLCWDLDTDDEPDGLPADYMLEIDQGAGTTFGLVVCDGEVRAVGQSNE